MVLPTYTWTTIRPVNRTLSFVLATGNTMVFPPLPLLESPERDIGEQFSVMSGVSLLRDLHSIKEHTTTQSYKVCNLMSLKGFLRLST